jgi:[citrate (pro-3S)-lyase] ligase
MNLEFIKWPKIINDKNTEIIKKIEKLLSEEKFRKDLIEEYAVIFSEENDLIGVIGRYANNLRCLVVDKKYRSQNIANILIDFMSKRIYKKNFREIFVFSKPINFDVFQNLGFNLIFQNENFGFLTNRYDLFQKYLNYLSNIQNKNYKKNNQKFNNNSVIVMNCNPYTKGHEYLISKAVEKSNLVYIIMVKEDISLFTYQQRLEMTKLGVKKFKNVQILEGSDYLISKNVFPSYFFRTQEEFMLEQICLDISIFTNYIVPRLKITKRFVGEEPFSYTTNLYNKLMKKKLNLKKLELIIVPRINFKNNAISATQVRKLFIQGKFSEIKNLVPRTTLEYLTKLNYKKYQKNKNLLKLVDKKN